MDNFLNRLSLGRGRSGKVQIYVRLHLLVGSTVHPCIRLSIGQSIILRRSAHFHFRLRRYISNPRSIFVRCTLTSRKARGNREQTGIDIWEENFVANFNSSAARLKQLKQLKQSLVVQIVFVEFNNFFVLCFYV